LTTIRYDVPSAGNVVVSVYDASGALLTTLVNGARAPGSYSVRWDGRNAAGNPASSGVYFVKLSVNGQTTTRKVALVK
jgi:flagellar hook assembly protein FlgD